MDKYEYRIRAEEINSLIERKEYVEAVKIADTIDWRRVRSVVMLCKVSELYKMNRRYEDSKEVLLLAYDLQPNSRKIVYSLCELSIKLEETVQAVEYYKEFIQIAPRDTGRFILQYRLYEAQDVSLEERIAVLEEYKKRDYREKWAYELAYLYHRIGLATRCVEECDELILWFGEGRYVIKALELKMLHAPLTPIQQEKYNARFMVPVEEAKADAAATAEAGNAVLPQEAGEPSLPIEIKSIDPTRAKTEEIPSKQVNVQAQEPVMPAEMEMPEEVLQIYHGVGEENEYPQQQFEMEEADLPENETEEVTSEETLSQTAETAEDNEDEDADMKIVNPAEDLDIHVKTIDMGDAYNTINLQEELAKNLAEILAQEDMEALDATKALPVDSIFQATSQGITPVVSPEINTEAVPKVSLEMDTEAVPEIAPEETKEIPSETVSELVEEASEPEEESTAAVKEVAEISVPQEIAEEEIKEEVIEESPVQEPEEGEAIELEETEVPEETEVIAEEDVQENEPEEVQETETEVVESGEAIAQETAEEPVVEESGEEEPVEEEPIELEETEELEEIEEIAEIPEAEESAEMEATEMEATAEAETTAEAMEEAEEVEQIQQPQVDIQPLLFGKNEPLPEAFIQAVQSVAMEAAKEAAKQAAHATVEAMKEMQPEVNVSDKEDISAASESQDNSVQPQQLQVEEPEPQVEKQITGQLSFTDIMAEWEETKKAHEEKHLQEMKQRVMEQTGPLFADFDAATKAESSLDMLSPMLDVFSDTEGLVTEVENALTEDATEAESAVYETPVEEEAPVVTEALVAEEIPVVPETPVAEEIPVVPETLVAEEIPVVPETQALAEIPVTENILEDRPSSFNTEEINGLEDKLMNALGSQHYETSNIPVPVSLDPVVKEEIIPRSLTKEEKELFGSIAQTKETQEKVAYALDSISLVPSSGNVIVTGEKGTGALEIAQNIAIHLSKTKNGFTGNAITYTGKELAEMSIVTVMNEVVNGALIVDNAGDMSANLCGKLIKAADDFIGKGIVFIFVDTKADIERLTRAYQKISEYFDVHIDITTLDNNGLVNFGREYAREKEYSIDDMGVLALYNRIEERQTNEHAVTVEEVKEIVNEAIIKAEKKNLTHFMDIVFAKRYDKDDMVVLREKDFMNE